MGSHEQIYIRGLDLNGLSREAIERVTHKSTLLPVRTSRSVTKPTLHYLSCNQKPLHFLQILNCNYSVKKELIAVIYGYLFQTHNTSFCQLLCVLSVCLTDFMVEKDYVAASFIYVFSLFIHFKNCYYLFLQLNSILGNQENKFLQKKSCHADERH